MIPIPSKNRNQLWYTGEDRQTVAMLTTKGIKTFFDAGDLEKIQKYAWSANFTASKYYRITAHDRVVKNTILLPKLLLPGPGVVRHKDNDTTNNRRDNLIKLLPAGEIKISPDSDIIEGPRNRCRFKDESREVVVMEMVSGEEVQLDFEDLAKVAKYRWYAYRRPNGFVLAITKNKFMHRLICPGVLSVDHINRDPSDNRKKNLKQASPTEQQNNQNLRKRNKSGINGVTQRKGSTDSSGAWVTAWICTGKSTNKTFSYGKGKKYGTSDEAKIAAITLRRDVDALNGCTNGHEVSVPVSMPIQQKQKTTQRKLTDMMQQA